MKFKYNGQWIEIPTGGGGTSVIPNPSYTPEDESFLETIKIGNDIFKIPIRVYWELPSTDDFDEGDIIFGLNNVSASGGGLITAYMCDRTSSGYTWRKRSYGADDILVDTGQYTSVPLSTYLGNLGSASELDVVPFNDDSPLFFEASSVSVDKNGILSDAQTEFERIDEDISDLQTDTEALETSIANKQNIFQFSTIPEASASNVGAIIQYVGSSTSNYEKGCFYICNSVSVMGIAGYAWQKINPFKVASAGSATRPVFINSSGNFQQTTYAVNNVAELSYTVQSTWT